MPRPRRCPGAPVAVATPARGQRAPAATARRSVRPRPPPQQGRNAITERLAASVYKQAKRRASRRLARDVGHFGGGHARTACRSRHAQYDAARRADRSKTGTAPSRRRRLPPSHPQHRCRPRSTRSSWSPTREAQWAQAAGELERVSLAAKTRSSPRALGKRELYEKGGARVNAARAYERFVKTYRTRSTSPSKPATGWQPRKATATRRETALMARS